MAAPGMPNAVSTPSRRITRTAASIALILAIYLCLFSCEIVYKPVAGSYALVDFWVKIFCVTVPGDRKIFLKRAFQR
jgi:hypothetical protein